MNLKLSEEFKENMKDALWELLYVLNEYDFTKSIDENIALCEDEYIPAQKEYERIMNEQDQQR